jgi:hypothetical protein
MRINVLGGRERLLGQQPLHTPTSARLWPFFLCDFCLPFFFV